MRLYEFHVLDHRMAIERAKLADNAQQQRLRLRPLELDLAFADISFDAGQQFEEVILPGRTPKLSIGDRFEPGVFLLLDDFLDFAVLDGAKGRLVDFALFPLSARLL